MFNSNLCLWPVNELPRTHRSPECRRSGNVKWSLLSLCLRISSKSMCPPKTPCDVTVGNDICPRCYNRTTTKYQLHGTFGDLPLPHPSLCSKHLCKHSPCVFSDEICHCNTENTQTYSQWTEWSTYAYTKDTYKSIKPFHKQASQRTLITREPQTALGLHITSPLPPPLTLTVRWWIWFHLSG